MKATEDAKPTISYHNRLDPTFCTSDIVEAASREIWSPNIDTVQLFYLPILKTDIDG